MFELYSIRNSKENLNDFYEYDNFSNKIRTQIFLILDEYLFSSKYKLNDYISRIYEKESGEIIFSRKFNDTSVFEDFIYACSSEELIDFIDVICYFIWNSCDLVEYEDEYHHIEWTKDKIVSELNHKFKQSHMGYEIIEDKVVRVDNELLHLTVTKPALHFLKEKDFKGAEEEIFKAFSYYTDGDYENTVLFSMKAFESTMKTICFNKGYASEVEKKTAKELINIVLTEGYVPEYLRTHLSGLRSTLESGLPPLRNNNGGHGQGDSIRVVSSELASYAFHLACTNILFLANLYEKDNQESNGIV
ncbi:STM4504/CBY_0614 family protein [Proteiniclasticum ruminis]|uniref:Abortive infection C-terminus n=1 Tax=Proteiniclasticum ruminis TaxID=398199 RepID=A0A1G8I639_9CLOT|nr:hypothetical protein [Proteiniclasticum ruminis]SDI14408.1 hypothetical protein SAMN05421804_101783 [Proteiniclasticum ruminis]